jgi:hypothetical protein
MRSSLSLACAGSPLMACQTTPTPSFNDPAVIERCAAQSGFTARSNAARAAGATGRIQSTPDELAAINACAGGAGTAQLKPVAGVPQSTSREVTATGVSKTYTYGTPPATGAATTTKRGQRIDYTNCTNPLTGGSGYRCVNQ